MPRCIGLDEFEARYAVSRGDGGLVNDPSEQSFADVTAHHGFRLRRPSLNRY